MFYFRINKLKITDNRESFLFWDAPAEVKIISFVNVGNDQLPDMTEFVRATDPARKREIVQQAVRAVAAARIFTEIDNVKDNHVFTFGDTGYVLFQASSIPQDFNWNLIVIESDSDVRNIGEMIDGVVRDSSFGRFVDSLGTLLSASGNPQFTAAVEISKFIVSVVAQQLRNNQDDLIGVLYMSLNRREHYPHAVRDRQDVSDLTGNMLIDYSLFGYEE